MLAVLLIAGIALLSGGLVTLGFGISVKEFAFGGTLILSGTVAGCTGLILLALWTVVRELKDIAAHFTPGRTEILEAELDDEPPPEERPLSFGRAPPASAVGKEAVSQSPALPPWQDEPAPRDRGRPGAPSGEPEPAAKPRRDLMFSTSTRKERGPVRASEGSASGPAASADDSWPRERFRPSDQPPRRSLRPPLRSSDPDEAEAPDYPPVAARAEDRKAVTLLKSGVVDGMAYSLYSDGSIEAQMPEGMMRFASIDELRSHLDQRP
jgi:hypothetical protein